MSSQPPPEPSWIYRGPLGLMDWAPSSKELLLIALLAVGAGLLLLIAVGLARSYAFAVWKGPADPGPWQLPTAGVAALACLGLLALLWLELETIAARMGIGLGLLALLLLSEVRGGKKRRR